MKINEVIVEGIVSGLVGGVKGLAKGVAELPGKAAAGYQAGAASAVTPPEGWKPGAVQANAPSSDLAAAIASGRSGDIGFRQATDARTQDAPEGTTIGQWKKTKQGWVNSSNNTTANPAQSKTLDKEWTKFAQTGARQQAQPVQPDTTQQSAGTQQPATAQQSAGTQVPAPTTADNGDLFAGDTQQPNQPRVVQTVITPTGRTVYLKSDKKWYHDDDDNSVVVDQSAIKQLNQMVINAKETAKAKGTKVPKIIQAQSTQPAQPIKTHTGGRQKGGLSQTPNAIRKRAARAEMPAVFTSNRR
jgi:hypothetical protein